jgi:prepilin-type N-terminal cleavage/methylation domain-containing protein
MKSTASGFTLIELLIVVVIIGALAALAVPKFATTKEKAYRATMKADLRNLATAQEAYLYDWSTYYNGAIPSAQIDFTPSNGVAISISTAAMSGWGATATHVGAPTSTCALFMGSIAAVAPAVLEGEVRCQ